MSEHWVRIMKVIKPHWTTLWLLAPFRKNHITDPWHSTAVCSINKKALSDSISNLQRLVSTTCKKCVKLCSIILHLEQKEMCLRSKMYWRLLFLQLANQLRFFKGRREDTRKNVYLNLLLRNTVIGYQSNVSEIDFLCSPRELYCDPWFLYNPCLRFTASRY